MSSARYRGGQRIDNRIAQMEDVLGECDREERAFMFFELVGRGQNLSCFARRFGHGDVDHRREVQRAHSVAYVRYQHRNEPGSNCG